MAIRLAAQSRSASEDQSAQHDGGGVAAQLERHVLARHGVQDRVADRTGAGERDHRQPRVVDQAGHRVVRDRQHRPHPGGQVGLGEQLAEQQRGQRRRRRRLDHDRRADRQRRRDLVRHQVQREVERRDPQHRPAREAADDRRPPGRGGLGVQAQQLAAVAADLLGGPPERGRRPGSPRRAPSCIGLPFSAVISRATSSARSASRRGHVPQRRRPGRRASAGAATGAAAWAAATAASTWRGVGHRTVATSEPSYGWRTSRLRRPVVGPAGDVERARVGHAPRVGAARAPVRLYGADCRTRSVHRDVLPGRQ